MATHEHKRPYAGSQPSITSYFPHSVSPTSSYQQTYSITPSLPVQSERPQLPASIQSNLLSVGMRVRKSVPEGYKTGTYSAFTLFSEESPLPPMQTSPTRNRPRARELTPFCGILKVGGMAQQQCGIYKPGGNPGDATDEDEEYDVPPLSQGSTISSDSVATPWERKRRMEFDDEEYDVPPLSQGSTISSDSVAIPWERKRRMEFDDEPPEAQHDISKVRIHTVGVGERAIAVPRRKKVGAKVGVMDLGQENADLDFDFGEADFLDYRLMEDSDMGGV